MFTTCSPESPGLDTTEQNEVRKKPEITSDTLEEDEPFDNISSGAINGELQPQQMQLLNEQTHKHGVEDYKNKIGFISLCISIISVIILSLLDVLFTYLGVKSDLLSNAFEFLKTIGTVVLGYLFATTSKN